MKKIFPILFFFFLFTHNLVHAQLFFSTGGDQTDIGRDVVKNPNTDETYLAATVSGTQAIDFEPKANQKFVTPASSANDIVLVKYDNSSNVLWLNHFGNSGDDVVHSVKLDNQGGVYITGYFEGIVDFDPNPNTQFNLISSGKRDGFIAKYSESTGDLLWARGIGAEGNDEVVDVAINNANLVFIIGSFENSIDLTPEDGPIGEDILISNGSRDYFVAKYDGLDKSFYWGFAIGSVDDDLANDAGGAIAIDPLGAIDIMGSFRGSANFEPNGSTLLSTFAASDIFVAQYFENAGLPALSWVTGIGGSGEDIASLQGLTTDLSGSVYVTGQIGGEGLVVSGYNLSQGIFTDNKMTTIKNGDIFIAKLDQGDGMYIYAKAIGGDGVDFGRRIAVDGNNNLCLTADFQATIDVNPSDTETLFINSTEIGNGSSILHINYDEFLNINWANNFQSTSGNGPNSALGLDLNPLDGNSILCGKFHNTVNFNTIGTDELTAMADLDIFVVEYDITGNLRIKPVSNCPEPSNVVVSNVTSTSATITFDPTLGPESYDIRYRKIGDSYSEINTFTNTADLLGLTPDTEYEVSVRSVCAGDEFSDYIPVGNIKFRTTQANQCEPVTIGTFGATSSTVQVTWTPFVTNYKIQWRKKGSIPFFSAFDSKNPPYLITGLTPNTQYEVIMTYTCLGGGDSPVSNTSEFTTLGVVQCDQPVIILSEITSSSVKVTWTPSGDSYEINYKLSSSSNWTSLTGIGNSYIIENLDANSLYDIQVRNKCGNQFSDFSAITQFNTLVGLPCDKPKPYVINIKLDRAEVMWFDTLKKYEIQYRKADTGSWIIWTKIDFPPPFEFAGLSPNTTYEVRMRQVCGSTYSAFSDTVRFNTLTEPCPKPILSIKSVDFTSALIQWTPAGDTVEIQYHLVSQVEWKSIKVVRQNEYLIPDLINGTTYQIRLRSFCSNGFVSDYSNIELFITEKYPPCVTPTVKVDSITDRTVTLSWAPAMVEYEIEFRPVGDIDWNGIGDVRPSPVTIDNLEPYTDYEFRVRQICRPDHFSEFTPEFRAKTKLVRPCLQPEVTLLNVFSTYMTLDWTPIEGLYEISYKPENGTNWLNIYNNQAPPYILKNLEMGVKYEVRIRNICGDDFSDFSFTRVVTTPVDQNNCPTPVLTVNNPTTTTVQIDWTPTSLIFEVTYRQVGKFKWERITRNAPNPMILTNLKPGTEYEVRVRNYCDEGYSYYSKSDTFSTLPVEFICEKPTLALLSVDKNSVDLSFTPQMSSYEVSYRSVATGAGTGWITIYAGLASPYTIKNLKPNTPYQARIRRFCEDQFTLSEYSNVIEFKTLPDIKPTPCDNPTLDILQNTITENLASITWTNATLTRRLQIKAITGTLDTAWKTINIVANPPYTFTDLIPCTRYLVKLSNMCNGDYSSGVEQEFTTVCPPPPSCPKLNIELVSATAQTISVSWDEPTIVFEFSYRLKGSTEWVVNYDNTPPPYTITGIMPDTTYEVRLRNYCDPEFSLYSNVLIVKTPKPNNNCKAPTNIRLTNLTSKTALFQWKHAAQVAKYRVLYKIINDDANITSIITQDFIWLANLRPNRNYQFQIKTLCSDGSESDYSTIYNFTTPSSREGSEEMYLSDLSIYPNPSNGDFTISFNSQVNELYEIEITDLMGKSIHHQIYTPNLNQNSIEVSLPEISKGMYLLRIKNKYTDVIKNIILN